MRRSMDVKPQAAFSTSRVAPRVPVPTASKHRVAGPFSVLPLPAASNALKRNNNISTRASVAAADAPTQQQPGDASAQPTDLMPAQLTWPSRSHGCGAVTSAEIGANVIICGWVDRNRNMGGVQFFDVRDHTGLLQVRPPPGLVAAVQLAACRSRHHLDCTWNVGCALGSKVARRLCGMNQGTGTMDREPSSGPH